MNKTVSAVLSGALTGILLLSGCGSTNSIPVWEEPAASPTDYRQLEEYWDAARDFHEGLAAVGMEGTGYGFIDKRSALVIDYSWHNAMDFSEGLAAVMHQGKWGYIDRGGKLVIDCQWDAVWDFSEGMAAVMEDGRIGFIDTSGKYVIRPTWRVDEGILRYADYNAWSLLYDDAFMEDYIENDEDYEELLRDMEEDYWLYDWDPLLDSFDDPMNDTFRAGLRFYRGCVVLTWPVEEAERGFIVDAKGDRIYPDYLGVGQTPLHDDSILVYQEQRDGYQAGYIDYDGGVLVEPRWAGISPFSENGVAAATRTRDFKSVLINRYGDTTVRLPDEISYGLEVFFSKGFRYGLMPYGSWSSESYGYIDETGEIVLEVDGYPGAFYDGVAAVGRTYITLDGSKLVESDDFLQIHASSEGMGRVYDYENGYTFVEFLYDN